MKPYVCPNCGNTTEQKGITHCFLEWRIAPVHGEQNGTVYVRWDEQEGADCQEETTMKNVPNVTPDMEHFFCNACNWNWFDFEKETENYQID